MKAIILVLSAWVAVFAAGCLPGGNGAKAAAAPNDGPAAGTAAATPTLTIQQQLLEQQKTILALQEEMKKNAAALKTIHEQNDDLAEAAQAWAKRADSAPPTSAPSENTTYVLNMAPPSQPAPAYDNVVVEQQPSYPAGYGYWNYGYPYAWGPVYYGGYYGGYGRHHGYYGGYGRGYGGRGYGGGRFVGGRGGGRSGGRGGGGRGGRR